MTRMSNEEWSGVSVVGLEKLMADIVDYAERTNHILNDISDLVDGTASYFVCDSGRKFREEFGLVETSFPIVNKNILNYNTDLLDAKLNYVNREQHISGVLHEGQSLVNKKIGSEGGEK